MFFLMLSYNDVDRLKCNLENISSSIVLHITYFYSILFKYPGWIWYTTRAVFFSLVPGPLENHMGPETLLWRLPEWSESVNTKETTEESRACTCAYMCFYTIKKCNNLIEFYHIIIFISESLMWSALTWGIDLTRLRRNEETTDAYREKMESGGMGALVEMYQQPRNSAHLLHVSEWGVK